MGLFDSVFRRSRRVTDDVPTVPLPKTGLTFRVGNVQGVGLRERQEDSFAILNVSNAGALAREGLLAVVADGMGGMADGKQASESAVAALCQSFRERAEEMPVPQWFRESAHAVSDSVYEQFSGRSGTTLVAVHIQRNQLHWVSVGDSAIYLYRSGGVFQLNREHTYLNQLYTRELTEDIICKERAEQDEDARRLTAFVGIDRLTEVDGSLRPLPLQSGDVLLLCSDGISGVLTPPELMEAMRLAPDEGCALLETLVLEKQVPEQDNYTGIMISCK